MTWMLDRDGGAGGESHAARLRRLLEREGTLSVPGTYNPLTALIARKVGFEALYFSGAAFSASLGIPDIGLFTLDELAGAVRWVVKASNLPFIVDADTGFGEAINVIRTVRELEAAGVAAIHIEDQVLPKRCGHLDGKSVVSAEAFAEKIRAAVDARDEMLIIARTDSRDVHGMDEAIKRGKMCLEAGADIIFPEAMESEEEFAAYAREVGGMLLANMTEFGKSPYLSAERFGELGYKIVIFPVSTLRVAAKAAEELLTAIRDEGTQYGWLDRMQTRRELYDLIEYDRYEETDRRLAAQQD